MRKVGSRHTVFSGRAAATSGGLKKSDLRKNKFGKIVSVRKSNFAKQKNPLGAFLQRKNGKPKNGKPKNGKPKNGKPKPKAKPAAKQRVSGRAKKKPERLGFK